MTNLRSYEEVYRVICGSVPEAEADPEDSVYRLAIVEVTEHLARLCTKGAILTLTSLVI